MIYKRTKKSIATACIVFAFILSFLYYVQNQDKALNVNSDNLANDYVEFIDVGQGDSALIASQGKYCLIDTGVDQGYSSIRKTLRDKNIKTIDVLIISHYHADHTGGLNDLVNEFNVLNLIYPEETPNTEISNDVLYAKKECLAEDGDFYTAKAGQVINLGDFKLTVLYQGKNFSEENNRSVFLMAKIGDKKFLFTGDAESGEERELLNQNLNIKCDVLKVAHHGGSTSTSEDFLSEANPDYAVISCGKDNMYGHPHRETIFKLDSKNIKTYSTAKRGNIIFTVNDGRIKVITEK